MGGENKGRTALGAGLCVSSRAFSFRSPPIEGPPCAQAQKRGTIYKGGLQGGRKSVCWGSNYFVAGILFVLQSEAPNQASGT